MTRDEFTDAALVVLADFRNEHSSPFRAADRLTVLADKYAQTVARRAAADAGAVTPTAQAMRRILLRAASPDTNPTGRQSSERR